MDTVGGWYTRNSHVLLLKMALLFRVSLQEMDEVGMPSMQPMPGLLSSAL